MALTRRGLLLGILAAGAAPAIVHNPMRIWVPKEPEAWGFRVINPPFLIVPSSITNDLLAMAPDALRDAGVTLLQGEMGVVDDGFTMIRSLPLLEPTGQHKRPKLGRW